VLHYSPTASAQLQSGIKVITVVLKTKAGQKKLYRELAKTDVLITTFRPSASEKIG
jgi:alpha-methylacyl-CoA racemase